VSTLGLSVFDRTVQVTNIWLDEIMEKLGPDRQISWKVLSTVLHKLRDMLQPNLAAHLGTQLPLLVRGVYYDLYAPSKQPTSLRDREDFVSEVEKWLWDIRPVDPLLAIETVFGVLNRHLSAGEVAKVREALPASTRSLWAAPEVQAKSAVFPDAIAGELSGPTEAQHYAEAHSTEGASPGR
jgi:uncharacterized protein (DUF2267 family)